MVSVIIASRKEIPLLSKLLIGFRDELGRAAPTTGEIEQSLETLLADSSADFFVAMDKSANCLGYLQQRYRYSVWLTAFEASIEDLYVAPEHRRLGIGSALVKASLAEAAEKGCKLVTVDTNEVNGAALALYESFGFFSGSSKFPGKRQLLLKKRM